MSKATKQVTFYVLGFILICIAPVLLLNYRTLSNMETFHERLSEDNEICYQRAKRDGVDTRWCNEISDAATLAYRQSTRTNDLTLLMPVFSGLFLVLIVSVATLRKQVEELKEKIDV